MLMIVVLSIRSLYFEELIKNNTPYEGIGFYRWPDLKGN